MKRIELTCLVVLNVLVAACGIEPTPPASSEAPLQSQSHEGMQQEQREEQDEVGLATCRAPSHVCVHGSKKVCCPKGLKCDVCKIPSDATEEAEGIYSIAVQSLTANSQASSDSADFSIDDLPGDTQINALTCHGTKSSYKISLICTSGASSFRVWAQCEDQLHGSVRTYYGAWVELSKTSTVTCPVLGGTRWLIKEAGLQYK